jgi:nicotinate-nucleotide pyrophosphorylase (carboxylating)
MKRISPGLKKLLRMAVKEDLGSGDVTSLATIPASAMGYMTLFAKEEGIIAGLPVFKEVHKLVDSSTRVELQLNDGSRVTPGVEVANLTGRMRSLLAAERLSLNFMQRLSGIATFTGKFVEAAQPYKMKIYDTRKTTPLWRELEKYAVTIGGGCNHRFGLYDMILIKDNHIDTCGGIEEAAHKAIEYRRTRRKGIKIAVEVRSLWELPSILSLDIDLVLLDNMSVRRIRRAIEIIGNRNKPEIEISGRITLNRISKLGQAGVRRVSVGALTHSAPALDLSLKYST